jgi:hypothetical protein
MENDKTLTLEAGGFEILAADPPAEGGQPALPKFRMVAYTGAQMKLGWWEDPVIVDLAGIAIPNQKIPIRFGHDPGSGVGHTTSLAVEDGKLIAQGVVSRDTDEAREVVASAKNGFPWQISIGASAKETERLREGETSEINGRKVRGPLSLVRKATLEEISFVDLGADRKTKATIAAKAAKETVMPDDDKKDEGKKVEAGKVETQPTQNKKEETISARGDEADRMIADAYRNQAIRDMTIAAMAEYTDSPETLERMRDLGEKAIESKMAVKDYEIELLRLRRPPIGPGSRHESLRGDGDVLAAAAMISGLGDEVAVKTHGERAVEAARKKFGHDIGLQEIMLQAARANGYHGRDRVTVGNWREVWSYANGGDIRASGFSTVNLPNILGSVANKAIGKVAGEPGWLAPLIAGRASHSNFHSHTVMSMGINGSMASVGPGGELQHQRLSEETYTRQVGTRGAVLRLSRTDIINDDMSVFTQNAAALVRKAFNAREEALFTLIVASGAGSSHFTAARGNYITGATTVPGTIAGMAAAVKAFRKLKGIDSKPVGVEPAIVICNPTYEAAMTQLLDPKGTGLIASGLASTSAKTIEPSVNVYVGRFSGRPFVSPWLEDTSIGGSDAATSWYLFADPNILPCYEVAYLNGQETPTVEYFGLESEADTLGVAWRIYWDFGVAAANWRAGVKIAGA